MFGVLKHISTTHLITDKVYPEIQFNALFVSGLFILKNARILSKDHKKSKLY